MSDRWKRTLKDSLMIEKCIALDNKGHQCRKWATEVTYYHGHDVFYGAPNLTPTWVRAAFCDIHKG